MLIASGHVSGPGVVMPEFVFEPAAVRIEDHPNGDRIGERLSAYWIVRDQFLHVGVDVERTADVAEMLRQVRAPLLSVVRESADFEAAYLPLIAIAQRLYSIDSEASEDLLIELEKANSQRMEAREFREYLIR